MANDDKALGADEVEARLSELLSDISEAEKRDFLEKLEEWQAYKQKEKRSAPGNEFPFMPSVQVMIPILEITFKI